MLDDSKLVLVLNGDAVFTKGSKLRNNRKLVRTWQATKFQK